MELAQRYNDEKLVAESNISIADAYFEMSRFQSAIEFYEKALEYYYEEKESENKIYVYNRLGDSEKHLGNLNDALFYYQKPRRIY